MKRVLFSFAILICAAFALAQTAPATKPSMARGSSGQMLPVVLVPDIEAIVAKVPEEFWPGPKTTDNAKIAAFVGRMTAWTKANADGKSLDISAVQNLLKPSRGIQGGQEARFILPSGKEVDLDVYPGGKGAPKVTVFSIGFMLPTPGHPVLTLNVR